MFDGFDLGLDPTICAAGIPATIFAVAGIPATIFAVALHGYRYNMLGHETWLYSVGFLYHRYTPRTFYWEAIIQLRACCICVLSLLSNKHGQAFCALVVAVTYLG